MTGTIDIIFDTECLLCSRVVNFVLAHERETVARFIGAWSPEGQELARAHGLTQERLDETFAVIVGGQAHLASEGALEIARLLRPPWRWARILRFCPKALRDAVYFWVARNRLRLFGRHVICYLPPPEAQDRFIGISARRARPSI